MQLIILFSWDFYVVQDTKQIVGFSWSCGAILRGTILDTKTSFMGIWNGE